MIWYELYVFKRHFMTFSHEHFALTRTSVVLYQVRHDASVDITKQPLQRMTMTRLIPCALLAVLTLLAFSPTPAGAFLWRNAVKETPEIVAAVNETKECKEDLCAVPSVNNDTEEVPADPIQVEYGVDVSFPMAHASVSTNFPWLPHNMDPSIEIPEEYKGMVIQPLSDRQSFYENLIKGCEDSYDGKGARCIENEKDRIAMTLRQPQSMKVYTFVIVQVRSLLPVVTNV